MFLIQSLKELKTKKGDPFVVISIADKTGDLDVKLWETALSACTLMPSTVVQMELALSEYNGKLDGKVMSYGKALDSHDYTACDFEPASKYQPNDMWESFENYLYGFESSYFESVAKDLFDSESTELFKNSPAATKMHHSFKHGLLEHTLQMLQCAESLLKLPFFSAELNIDLCMFGIMFHDFGKIYEYSCEPGFKKRLQGLLVPHIPMVGARIYESANRFGVPEEVRDHMMHVVLAHHRLLAWGSPVTFACPEAAFVHYVDNLHGDVFGIIQAREAASGESFTYGFGEQRMVILKKPFDEVIREKEPTDGF